MSAEHCLGATDAKSTDEIAEPAGCSLVRHVGWACPRKVSISSQYAAGGVSAALQGSQCGVGHVALECSATKGAGCTADASMPPLEVRDAVCLLSCLEILL